MAANRKNHTTSGCYLRGFCDGQGRVMVRLPDRGVHRRHHTSVGYVKKFWGADQWLRDYGESWAHGIEDKAAPIFGSLPALWPLDRSSEDSAFLARFLALHIGRTYLGRVELERMRAQLFRDRPELIENHSKEELELLRGDAFLSELLMQQNTRLASLLAHMQWSLLRLEVPLATSDHPVVRTDLAPPGTIRPLRFRLTHLFACLEMRIVIDPRHVLLMTWRMSGDDDVVIKDAELAIDINAGVLGQSHYEVYWRPEERPRFSRPIERSIEAQPTSPFLYPDYSAAQAFRSPRFVRAKSAVQEMTSSGLQEVRMLDVNRAA